MNEIAIQTEQVQECGTPDSANQALREGWMLLQTYTKRIRIDPKQIDSGFDEKCVYVLGKPRKTKVMMA